MQGAAVRRVATWVTHAVIALIALAIPLHASAKGTKKDKGKVTVTWLAPASGVTLTAPANVALTATAESKQANQPIVLVEWFNGPTLIGSATAPSTGITYALPWSNLSPGSYTLTVAATNDKDDYDETEPVTITVVKSPQAITGFNPATPITYAPVPNNTFTLSASGGASGNPVAFTSTTPSVCAVGGTNGATVTVLRAGTCTLTAEQPGNTNYNAAPQVSTIVIINKASQAISGFTPPTPISYAPAPNNTFTLSAMGGASGNPVTFASTSPTVCIVSGATVTMHRAGTCTLTAEQVGNDNYTAAAPLTAAVVIHKLAQAITDFTPTATLSQAAGSSLTLTATGGASGNPVVFTSTPATICTTTGITGQTLTVVSAGTCTVHADQAANENYAAAPRISANIVINAEAQIYFIHADHLGTPRVITKASDNAKVWAWSNDDAFGNNAPDENPSGLGAFAFNLRFPGQYYDVETGTHYNYFRDYDPSTGRYVQSDPIGLRGGLTTFGYVSSSPLSRTDFYGLKDDGGVTRWGNWCGKNWSGGKNGAVIPENPAGPIDSVDECCIEHDYCYAKYECYEKKCKPPPEAKEGKKECDRVLVACLDKLKGKAPQNWPKPPKRGSETDAYMFCQNAKWWFK